MSTLKKTQEVFRYMTRDVAAIEPTATVFQAALLMEEHDVGALPVVLDGRAVGIVTDRDIALRCAGRDLPASNTPVGQVMTQGPTCVSELDGIDTAIELMEREQIRRVIVVGGGFVKGILSLADIARNAEDLRLPGEVLEKVSEPAVALD